MVKTRRLSLHAASQGLQLLCFQCRAGFDDWYWPHSFECFYKPSSAESPFHQYYYPHNLRHRSKELPDVRIVSTNKSASVNLNPTSVIPGACLRGPSLLLLLVPPLHPSGCPHIPGRARGGAHTRCSRPVTPVTTRLWHRSRNAVRPPDLGPGFATTWGGLASAPHVGSVQGTVKEPRVGTLDRRGTVT